MLAPPLPWSGPSEIAELDPSESPQVSPDSTFPPESMIEPPPQPSSMSEARRSAVRPSAKMPSPWSSASLPALVTLKNMTAPEPAPVSSPPPSPPAVVARLELSVTLTRFVVPDWT